MTPLFKKLNFKDQNEIFILNHPEFFRVELQAMSSCCKIYFQIKPSEQVSFIMIFVKTQSEINKSAPIIVSSAKGDAIIWYVYPKKSSKKYNCDFDRDHGWDIMGKLGLEGVRMVAIDEDWSALRFRKVGYIKKMTRSFAMTDEGKNKVNKTKI